jgi:acyl transferase domain-containing protein
MRHGPARDIAIVGLGCRFPGAPDLYAFWANILANRDVLREIPADRWPVDLFHDPDSDANDRVCCRRGGYLDAPIAFDPSEHGIMPLAVTGGEPEQFLVLDAARAALEDAAIDRDQLDRLRVEVVVGRGNYFNRGNLTRLQHGRIVAQTVGLLAALHPEWTREELELLLRDLKSSLPPFEAATIPGQLTNATAGRVADRLDLKGASYVVDAASASSLVALDLGRRALLERRADVALVGGVYLEADVDFPLVFQQLRALSPSGEARPFSADADGLVPGEGVGVVVLRRLRDAERAGYRIYAVIKGVGLAGDGRGRGLAAPSARGHARAMRQAYRDAGVDPGSVALIEGHGLGVPASDRAELRALRAVFPPGGCGTRALGAVSSQIGHAMPAAGMAGLIKTALALHHRVLPPTRHDDRPSPLLSGSGLELIGSPRPWIHGDGAVPRRAGVNAFGFAGINAHAVLEEHVASADGMTDGAMPEWDSEAFLISADDRLELAGRVRHFRDQVSRLGHVSLKDLAYTVNACEDRPRGLARLGLVVGSLEELVRYLEAIEPQLKAASCGPIRDARGIYYRDEPLTREGGLAFLFPGEGSQYPGMLADLCPHFPELRAVLDTADRIARESGEEVPPSRHLFGRPGAGSEALWATDTAVTAVLSSQWGMFQVLSRLGLRPDAVAGHSSGELPALAAAGAIRTERALEQQLAGLASVFRRLESEGAIPSARLVAAGTDRARAEPACRAASGSVSIAIDNCPHQVVLAGPPGEMESVLARLRAEGIVCEELPFARAYHTPSFAAVLGPLDAFYKSLELHPARIPVYSCSTAARMPESPETIRRLAAGQWTRPVAFRDTVEAMYRDGLRIFVDVGARGNLCGYVEDILRGRPSFAVAANLPGRSGTAQLNHLAASLFAQGVDFDASYLYARRRPRRLDLDAPAEPARSETRIEIGFPELRLSEAVIRRLSARKESGHGSGSNGTGGRTILSPFSEPPRAMGNGRAPHHLDGQASGNGHVPDHLLGELVAARTSEHPAHGPDGPDLLHEVDAWARDVILDDEPAMLEYLETMDRFLHTQREVMEAYLHGKSALSVAHHEALDAPAVEPVDHSTLQPGPWAGEVIAWEPGRSITTQFPLEPAGEPVAENHTLGGRRVSAIEPRLKGLPVVPFAVMAEMVAQVGSLLVPSGLILDGLDDVRAHRWVQYEEGAWLELRGMCEPVEPFKVKVVLLHHGGDSRPDSSEGRLVFEGLARFAERRSEPFPPEPLRLSRPRASKFTAERLYDEQWLFHGPPMQALAEVGPVSPDGITGSITVLPLAALTQPESISAFHTDPIVLDTFTHLLGCWGLDSLEMGDVVFPLRMGRLSIHGDPPPEGSRVDCRIRVLQVEHHRVRVDAEIVRPDGLLWMRIADWEDWRFHWPSRYRDVFRAPDTILVGEEVPLPGVPIEAACAVWLEPPGDMARPVWRDVLKWTQLGPAERSACLAFGGPEVCRTHRLWGRIAAKEAARRTWLAAGQPARFPADLAVTSGPGGQPRLIDRADPGDRDQPAISIAYADGLAVALAARDAGCRAGIDVAPMHDPLEHFDESSLSAGERALLAKWSGPSQSEGMARLVAARQAAAKAVGIGPKGAVDRAEVKALDAETGTMAVEVRNPATEHGREILKVRTARRGDHVWAWTLGERAEG